MTTITTGSSRLEQPSVNRLLGPALKSLYDIEVHLKKSPLEAELWELVDLNLAVMSINSWNRLSIAFRYEPEPE